MTKHKRKVRATRRARVPVATLPNDPEALLAPSQLTDVLGVTKKTLEKWRTKGGQIEFVKCGGLVRYRVGAVKAYLAAHTCLSTSE